MHFQPQQNKILVHLRGLREDSNIITPDNVTPLQPYGQVLAVGQACTRVAVGDKVLFMPEGAIAITLADVEHFVLDEGSVFGKYVEANLIDIAG